MSYRVVLHPLARGDLKAGSSWYEARSAGLGVRFANAFLRQTKQLEVSPARYRKARAEVRRCAVPQFPYTLYFEILDDTVLIVSVHANRMDPDFARAARFGLRRSATLGSRAQA